MPCAGTSAWTHALRRFPAGSRPVYAAGDLALKLYPQADGNASAVEASVLSAVEGALPVAAPRVHPTGDWDGWSYLLMSRLPGGPLGHGWAQRSGTPTSLLAGSSRK